MEYKPENDLLQRSMGKSVLLGMGYGHIFVTVDGKSEMRRIAALDAQGFVPELREGEQMHRAADGQIIIVKDPK